MMMNGLVENRSNKILENRRFTIIMLCDEFPQMSENPVVLINSCNWNCTFVISVLGKATHVLAQTDQSTHQKEEVVFEPVSGCRLEQVELFQL